MKYKKESISTDSKKRLCHCSLFLAKGVDCDQPTSTYLSTWLESFNMATSRSFFLFVLGLFAGNVLAKSCQSYQIPLTVSSTDLTYGLPPFKTILMSPDLSTRLQAEPLLPRVLSPDQKMSPQNTLSPQLSARQGMVTSIAMRHSSHRDPWSKLRWIVSAYQRNLPQLDAILTR